MIRILAVAASALLWNLLAANPATGQKRSWHPKRLEPKAAWTIGIRPWETQSTSPFGGSRWGGRDERRFALSQDGKFLVTEDAGGWQLEMWNAQTGKSLGKFGKIEDPVAIAVSPDGKHVVTTETGGRDETAVDLWDIGKKKRVDNLDAGVLVVPFGVVAFACDGRHIALGGTTTIHIWDIKTGFEKHKFTLPGQLSRTYFRRRIEGLCFTSDGKQLVVISRRQVFLLDAASGERKRLIGRIPFGTKIHRYYEPYKSVSVSMDGKLVAVGTPAGTVHIWEIAGSKELPPIPAHKGGVRAVQFLKDGKRLLTFGADNQALSWSVDQIRKPWSPPKVKVDKTTLPQLWKDLTGLHPTESYGARQVLMRNYTTAVTYLQTKLKPVSKADAEELNELASDLTSTDFNTRKRAALELLKSGEAALAALSQAERGRARFRTRFQFREVRSRLVNKLRRKFPTQEDIGHARALQLLARFRTPTAKAVLTKVSEGLPGVFLTDTAKILLDTTEFLDATGKPEAK